MEFQLDAYDQLVHQIYDASLDPGRWPDIVRDVGGALEASRGLLFTPLHRPPRSGFTYRHNIPDEMISRWESCSIADDPITQQALEDGLIVEGNAFNGCELVSTERLRASRLYSEVWQPMDIGHVCAGVVFGTHDTKTLPTAISLYRAQGDAPFVTADVVLMRRLMTHVSRSLGIAFHLGDRRLQGPAHLGALEHLASGVALLDRDGSLQFTNAAAERIFLDGRHVRRACGRAGEPRGLALAPHLHHVEHLLRKAVAQALAPLHEAEATHASKPFVLPDEHGKPGCVLHVASLGPSQALLGRGVRQARAIVFIYDLHATSSIAPQRLSEQFGLTQAEARAALALFQGGAAADMAVRLGISINTFKSQLQAVYAKTQTSRQADLLKLLLALERN